MKRRRLMISLACGALFVLAGVWSILPAELPPRVWRLCHDEQHFGEVPLDGLVYIAPERSAALSGVSATTALGLKHQLGPFVVWPDRQPRWHAWARRAGFRPEQKVGPSYRPTGTRIDEDDVFWLEHALDASSED